MKTKKMNQKNKKFKIIKATVNLALMLSLLAGILLFLPEITGAAPSQFDQTFGTGGKLVADITGGNDRMYDLVIQPDGKVVGVGHNFNTLADSFLVVRFNPDGSLDTSFDGDGKVTTHIGGFTFASSVEIQPDGKIIVAGYFSVNGDYDIVLVRYNPNGSLDTTFDGDGIVTTVLPTNQFSTEIVIQPDGKIIVGGDYSNLFMVARYNVDGSLDTTFDGDGIVTTALLNDVNNQSVLLQPDGKIIAGGGTDQGSITESDAALVRYNSDGSLDTSFDSDGKLTISVGDFTLFTSVSMQPDGKIVAAGQSGTNTLVARFNQDGSLDPTFDFDGIVTEPPRGNSIGSGSAAIQPDGKIIFFSSANVDGDWNFLMLRFNLNGSLDTSFHGDGKYDFSFPNRIFDSAGIAIRSDGKIIVAGGGDGYWSLARLLGDQRAVVTNNTPISPPDRVGTNPPTTVSSTVNISGLPGAVTKVRVSLSNITHTFPADLDVILQSPSGSFTLVASDTIAGSPGVMNFTATFDQSALAPTTLPLNNTGFYQPTNSPGNATLEPGGIDNLPSPGPGSFNFGTPILTGFDGENPNGEWKLFVVDDEAADTGSIGSWTLDITTTTSRLNNLTSDLDGDGKTDVGIFRPAPGEWWYLRSGDGGNRALQFGQATDKIVTADYTGDGKSDIAFFRPASGEWFILRSEDSSFYSFPFGNSTDIPTPADFDGDGIADPAIFRPSNQTWFINRSSDMGTTITTFGVAGDLPVAADYDGDGTADIGIYRPSNGQWWLNRTTAGLIVTTFGVSTDKTVQADYTGDGKADVAFFRPSTNEWFVLRSEDFSFYSGPFGTAGDIATPGDYDGDGRADFAIFRPSNSTWFIQQSTAGFTAITFGITNDIPIPNAYVR